MKFNRLSKALALIVSVAMMVLLLAGCATTDATATTDGTASGSGSMILMLVIMVVVFYFFLIRPENKKKKQAEEMRSSIAVGDDVTTIGGLVGKVVAVKENFIVFETGEDRVRIQVTKWAISSKGKQNKEQK
jgi:preprotein translocase subunit YajC